MKALRWFIFAGACVFSAALPVYSAGQDTTASDKAADTAPAAPEAPVAPTPPPAEIAAPAAAPEAPEAAVEAGHAGHAGHPVLIPKIEKEVGEDDTHDEATDPEEDDHSQHTEGLVTQGSRAEVPVGQTTEQAVAIFSDVLVQGRVDRDAVAVIGSNRIEGSAGGAAVAILGNVYVNGHVGRDVVAVMGGVELGPKAVVDGQVVAIGGPVKKAPGALVRGQTVNMAVSEVLPNWAPVRAWFSHAAMYGRPLCLHPEAMWAWWFALTFVLAYVLIGLLFPSALNRCADTLERSPGRTVLASFLTAFLAPLLTLVLLITVVGGPLFILFMLIAGAFGKAAFLVWVGRRLGVRKVPLAILAGSGLLLALYLVPFAGFGVLKVTDVLGTGMAVYTLMLSFRKERSVPPAPSTVPPAPASGFVPPAFPVDATGTVPPAASAATAADPSVAENAAPGFAPIPPLPPLPPLPPIYPSSTDASQRLSAAALPRAGFFIRLAASAIDAIVVALVVNLLPLDDYWVLCYAIYCVTLWKLRGATLGGIICGLKVVRIDDRPVDWTTSIVRGLGGFLSLAVAGLGFIWVAIDDDAQSWHDRIAGTTIVALPKRHSLI